MEFPDFITTVSSATVCSGVAIGHLASILQDSREILRNEAVLLFCELSINSKDLPVLFAFESGFELIISILDSEGWTDGGIIVQDCLQLATLVLEDNTNTQSFFREMGFLHKLLPLYHMNSSWNGYYSTASRLLTIYQCVIGYTQSSSNVIASKG